MVCVLILYTSTSFALEPIPEESGISGFVTFGAGVFSIKSNMIAGSGLSDFGKENIDSIFDKPGDAKTKVLPVLVGELRYTFAQSRTQVFLGNRFEDFLRFDFTTALGVRQELPDSSTLGVGFVFGLPTRVWEDPYVENRDRDKTDRSSPGARIIWDEILESNFQLEFVYQNIDIHKELSGRTQLNLPQSEAGRLDRDGNRYRAELLYRFFLGERRHRFIPALRYVRDDLDGDAMSNNRYALQLTYGYDGEKFAVVANANFAHSEHDKENPIYDKTQKDDSVGLGLTGFYKKPFGAKKWSVVGSVFGNKSYSNIDFYESEAFGVAIAAFYRF
jgi:hypothetical protein